MKDFLTLSLGVGNADFTIIALYYSWYNEKKDIYTI